MTTPVTRIAALAITLLAVACAEAQAAGPVLLGVGQQGRHSTGTFSAPGADDATVYIATAPDRGTDGRFLEENIADVAFLTSDEIASGRWLSSEQLDPGQYYVMLRATAWSCLGEPSCLDGVSGVLPLTVPKPRQRFTRKVTRSFGTLYLRLTIAPLGESQAYQNAFCTSAGNLGRIGVASERQLEEPAGPGATSAARSGFRQSTTHRAAERLWDAAAAFASRLAHFDPEALARTKFCVDQLTLPADSELPPAWPISSSCSGARRSRRSSLGSRRLGSTPRATSNGSSDGASSSRAPTRDRGPAPAPSPSWAVRSPALVMARPGLERQTARPGPEPALANDKPPGANAYQLLAAIATGVQWFRPTY
jgi:hypothetical protein